MGEGLGNYVPSEDKPTLPDKEDREEGEGMDTQPVLTNCGLLLLPSLAVAILWPSGQSHPLAMPPVWFPSSTGPLHSLTISL